MRIRKLTEKEKAAEENRNATLDKALRQPQTERNTTMAGTRLSKDTIKAGAVAVGTALKKAGDKGLSALEARHIAEQAAGQKIDDVSSYGSMLWQGGARNEDGRYYARGVRGSTKNGTNPEQQKGRAASNVSDKPVEFEGELDVHVTDKSGLDVKVPASRVSIWRRHR